MDTKPEVNPLWIVGICDNCETKDLQLRNADCEFYFCSDCWKGYKDAAGEGVEDFYQGVN